MRDLAVVFLGLLGVFLCLTLSFGLLWGWLGRLFLAHAALAHVCAYWYAAFTVKLGWPEGWAAASGCVLGLVLGLVIGASLWRLKEEAYALATLGVAVLVQVMAKNLGSVTGGVSGIAEIPSLPSVKLVGGAPGIEVPAVWSFTLAIFSLVVILIALRSMFGVLVRATAEDRVLLATSGHCPRIVEVRATAVAGAVAGLGGVAYAQLVKHVGPTSLGFSDLILVLVAVVLGGRRSVWGATFAALGVAAFRVALRFLPIPSHMLGGAQVALLGVILLFLLLGRPSGIFRDFHFAQRSCARADDAKAQ